MKRIYIIIIAIIAISSCSKKEEQQTAKWAEMIEYTAGHWKGELHSDIFNITEYEELTFTPYANEKRIVSIFGEIKAHGEVKKETYIDSDKKMYNSDICYYTFLYTEDNGVVLSFYAHNNGEVNNKEDRRFLNKISSNKFLMRKYGLADNNYLTYTKM